MQNSGADALIVDLEDFTPASKRQQARDMLPELIRRWHQAGCVTVVRINQLDQDGQADLGMVFKTLSPVVSGSCQGA